MTPERWAQIDRIHTAALDRPMAERAAFLDEACAGDPALRREVESLLAYARRGREHSSISRPCRRRRVN